MSVWNNFCNFQLDFQLSRGAERFAKEQKEMAQLNLEREKKAKQEAICQWKAIKVARRYCRLHAAAAEAKVCRFLEVSRLSFSQEFGPKLKEGYVMVEHLSKFSEDNKCSVCCLCHCFGCWGSNWKKVSLVLKPGFLAFLEDHLHTKLLDIAIFDVLPASSAKGHVGLDLAKILKERNPLRHSFQVSCGNRKRLGLQAKRKFKIGFLQ